MDEIERAHWLSKGEKTMLLKALSMEYFKALKTEQQQRLTPLLLSILYAENELKESGKKLTLWIEAILVKLGIAQFFCATLGMWNVHVCHGKRLGYSLKEFRPILEDPLRSTQIVMAHLVEDIGLEKAPELIFAEYNHNVLCTSIVALQKALNSVTQKEDRIEEDGLVGPAFKRLVSRCSHLLPSFFSLEHLDEEMVLQTVRYLNETQGFSIKPHVPQRVIKKDLKFLLKRRRARALFERDIDVPRYVAYGMQAFRYLENEEHA